MIDIETAMNGLLEYEKDIVKRDREGFKGFPVQMNPIDFVNLEPITA